MVAEIIHLYELDPGKRAVRQLVRSRTGACIYCGFKPSHFNGLTVDHIQPESKGGLTVPENLVAACGECNRLKGSENVWTWMFHRGILDDEKTRHLIEIMLSGQQKTGHPIEMSC